MSKLSEIEQAVETLPLAEQEALLQFIAQRIRRMEPAPPAEELGDDPFAAMIGAFGSDERRVQFVIGTDGLPLIRGSGTITAAMVREIEAQVR